MTQQTVCGCCGMQLRASPKQRVSREKFRARKKTCHQPHAVPSSLLRLSDIVP